MGSPAGAGPLTGVRVVDLTGMVMGAYCTQILADMGASVIKVEAPEGDITRSISVGPAPGMSGVFTNINRGKRSIVLDLQSEDARQALRALIKEADVFAPSVEERDRANLIAGWRAAIAQAIAGRQNVGTYDGGG